MKMLSLSHRGTEVEIRERYALSRKVAEALRAFWTVDGVEEVAVLSTCNRVEIMWWGSAEQAELTYCWNELCTGDAEQLFHHLEYYSGVDALKHLLKVAAGLDSMVLGEPQILGQLKDAYFYACEAHTLGPHLFRFFEKAFHTAKIIRSETAIGAYAINISFLAVKLAEQIFDELNQKKALLLGAGEMAELAARHLVERGIEELIIANRTLERAVELADEVGASVVPYESFQQRLTEVDIVIVSTGAPDYVLTVEQIKAVQGKRRNRPLLVVDISVPRNADPVIGKLPNVYLYDVDALKKLADENARKREDAARDAESIIEVQVQRLLAFQEAEPVQNLIGGLHERWRAIGRNEVNRTARKLDLDADGVLALEKMIYSIVKKILHPSQEAIKNLHESEHWDEKTFDLIQYLFGVDGEEEKEEL